MNPADYGLPHTDFRKYQPESIDWCFSLPKDSTGTIEAPTGSGKTALSKAISSQKTVVALCRTKNLQAENYADTYGAAPLYGKANYKCIHHGSEIGGTCADCLYADQGMYKCELKDECEYLTAKRIARSSPFATFNYALWMSAKWARDNPPQVLFLDECHNLDRVVTDWVGCTVTEADRVEFNLPPFPKIKHLTANKLLGLAPPQDDAIVWLTNARETLVSLYKALKRQRQTSKQAMKEFRRCERLGMKIRGAMDSLKANADDWYIRAGIDALKIGREYFPGFQAKPLTAKHDFNRFFTDGHTTIAMSATVGNPATFAKELGIENMEFRAVPNRYAPETRPIYLLPAPAMGGAYRPDFETRAEKQADVIAEFINVWPTEWSGIIHVTRIKEENELRRRLAQRGLEDRVWSVPGKTDGYIPTNAQIDKWHQRLRRVPNSILISCSFHEGYNGLDERINISAKVPYLSQGERGSYSHTWMTHDGKRYRQAAATGLAQQMGRTRRGRDQDYDIGGGINGACAIADAAVKQIQKYLPEEIRQALVKW